MNLLVTGAGQQLADLVIDHFSDTHTIRCGNSGERLDWCNAEAVGRAIQGTDAVLHLAPFDIAVQGEQAEGDLIDYATRSTYVLMDAARKANVKRVVLATKLDVFNAYPDNYVIDESWQPQPDARADSLTPYLVEICCREFVRQAQISIVCLRFGELDKEDGTSREDAFRAFEGSLALEVDPVGYRWQIFHVCSAERFSTQAARKTLLQEAE